MCDFSPTSSGQIVYWSGYERCVPSAYVCVSDFRYPTAICMHLHSCSLLHCMGTQLIVRRLSATNARHFVEPKRNNYENGNVCFCFFHSDTCTHTNNFFNSSKYLKNGNATNIATAEKKEKTKKNQSRIKSINFSTLFIWLFSIACM